MGSLTGCMAKAGDLLRAEDRAALNEAAINARAKGGDRAAADKAAVQRVLDAIRAQEPQAGISKGVVWQPGYHKGQFYQGAQRSEPFFSALQRGVDGLKMAAAPALGWKETIKGLVAKGQIKADEVEWSGINEWLDLQKGKVTREQVAEFIRSNGVKVDEVALGGRIPASRHAEAMNELYAWAQGEEERGKATQFTDAVLSGLGVDSLLAIPLNNGRSGRGQEILEAIQKAHGERKPKYERYALPGGTNYREVLLTLPGERTAERGVFRSSHWDQPNVLAHIRLNDRTDADGKRVLFVEEIQSDWGQEGKKKGFREPYKRSELSVMSRDEVVAEFGEANADMFWHIRAPDNTFQIQKKKAATEQAAIAYVFAEKHKGGVTTPPKAPFVTATDKWLTLALKRVMVMAAQEGYARVAFVNGEQSAERYDLSKQVDSISYRKSGEQFRVRAKPLHGGEMVELGTLGADELEAHVGKEIAKKIVDGDGSKSGDMTILSGLDLKVGGEGMKAFYDKIVPNAASALLKKVGGGAIQQIPIGKKAADQQQPGFDITPALREKVAGGMPLFQEGSDGKRGSYDPSTRTIFLTTGSDLSTPLHEGAHHFLELMRSFSSAHGAPEGIRRDFDTLLRSFGVEGETPEARLAAWNGRDIDAQRAGHEQFATQFERYLMEGRAPTHALQPLFARFRSWLVHLYRNLSGTGAAEDLAPDVRQVFDRLLASEDAIHETERSRGYVPLPREAFKDAKAYEDYLALGRAATDEAISEMDRRSLRDMKWLSNAKSKMLSRLQREADAQRRSIREQVETEYDNSPEVLAKAEMDRLAGTPDDSPPARLAVALKHGFADEAHMLEAIAGRGTKADFVASETDRRMLIEHGEMTDPRAIEDAANAAVHNEVRARFMATGLRALTDSPVPAHELARAAKEVAAGIIAGKRIGELSASAFLAAERRATREALVAAPTDPAGAAEAQRVALLNNRLARAAQDAADEVRSGVRYLSRVADSPTIAAEFREQIAALLERYEFRQSTTNKQIAQRANLRAFLDRLEQDGIRPDFSDALINDARTVHYRELTMEEFRGVRDAVKVLEHLGREQNRLLLDEKRREFGAIRDEMTASIARNAGDREATAREASTWMGKKIQGLKRFAWSHIKAAIFARVLDGNADGPVSEHLVHTANARADLETTMRHEATLRANEILAPLFKGGGLQKKRHFPQVGQDLTKEQVFFIAANLGNEGNIQRLLGGEGWRIDQVRAIVASLSAQELRAVQQIWDHFESLRPLIGAKERRVYGKEPEWVQPVPIELTASDGSTVQLRGGYFPINYDRMASARAEAHADAESAKRQMQGAYTSATTRRGFTKTRVEEVTGRPLSYSANSYFSALNDVIHDLAWHEWLIDTNKILRTDEIDGAIRGTYGPEAVRQLRTWVNDIAVGESGLQAELDSAMGAIRHGVSIAGLGFNVMSAMVQPLGITQSAVRIGWKWVGRGLADYISNPFRATAEVNEMSDFMRNRSLTRFRELNELMGQIEGRNPVRQTVGRYAYWLMMRFQQMVDVPTWRGAYAKALAEGHDEAKARTLADQSVIDSQGGGQVKDLSAIERGGPTQKLFTVFYSFMNTALNMGALQTMSANTAGKKAKLLVDYAMLYSIPAVAGAILKNALTPGDSGDWDDPEKIAKKLAGQQIDYLMGLAVVVREFTAAGKAMAGTEDHARDYSGPAGVRLISDVTQLAKQVGQVLQGGEFDDAFRKAAINAAGDFLGLPSAQINRTWTGVQALAEGKTKNPAAVLFGYQEPK